MYWANFLHIYQPAEQAKDILDAIVNQSYRRIVRGMKEIPNARMTLNISGILSELLLENGYEDVINDIGELAKRGNIEFTETAKYHAFLPYLPDDEIERQITLNHTTNKKIFGEVYNPLVLFPPEMAYDKNVARVADRMGYKTILLDEISYKGSVQQVPYDRCIEIAETKLKAVFRDRRISNAIISAVARTPETFYNMVAGEEQINRYVLTAMDGETFGHHRPGLEELLFALMRQNKIKQLFVSEIIEQFPQTETKQLTPGTWASSEDDIERGEQFYSWRDPKNRLHKKQWELFELTMREVKKNSNEPEYKHAQWKLDVALASDQFFWASGRPWWSLEMIELGAWQLLEVMRSLGKQHILAKEKARRIYASIVAIGFQWQREGKIRGESEKRKNEIKIPFKERTLEGGKPEVYQVFINAMKDAMETAAKEKNYEEAILWRDAIWKLETKNDMYDAIHAVDLIRNKFPLGELESRMDVYKKEYHRIRGGQVEDRR
ncbi:MAG: hypothetical protein COU08_01895 [Candidatus Harrisonbacteria bacterium CG10_big_fil_rev_8_21_14_0_10_42_17]|uniref:UVR domain-containing protein n=1 Tax=Candidatus Harrisonbacteria bacterium CG10_big_fil_rev_8_21_14_0_10_42_17 TaxID=1974584 RepID=A0A2M6WIB7_9BACT|nr:MAG: hypothetical protein COU08_01895 [Candidatus Harrisonbacteria bacterium CG10_big_fil_rev_8_21_14_0_10_42_17]